MEGKGGAWASPSAKKRVFREKGGEKKDWGKKRRRGVEFQSFYLPVCEKKKRIGGKGGGGGKSFPALRTAGEKGRGNGTAPAFILLGEKNSGKTFILSRITALPRGGRKKKKPGGKGESLFLLNPFFNGQQGKIPILDSG